MQSSGFGSLAQPPSGVSPRKPAERISRIFTVRPPFDFPERNWVPLRRVSIFL